MKKILGIAFCLCLVTVFAFADASGEIVEIDLDAKGNIRIWTQYKVDGVEVKSRYPKINGKFVYCSRYNKRNFLVMDKTEITQRVVKDIQAHIRTLIQKEFDKNAPETINQLRINYNIEANQEFMDAYFPVLKKIKTIEIESVITLDTDNDGIQDKEIKVKTDGTKTITDIITP